MDEKLFQQALGLLYQATGGKPDMLVKTAANDGNGPWLHGSQGLWNAAGLEREIITAHIRPMGLASSIPLLPSVNQDPRFGSLTGYSGPHGSQPTESCGDAPTGYVKGCNLTARFGRLRYDTHTIDMSKVMLKLHRGDFTDLQLYGRVLGLTDLPSSGLNEGQILNILTMSELVTVGVLFERELTRQFWQGVTTVANEFPGLDVQIATGQKDADTGTLCPALDSDVKSYAYQPISNTIVTYLSMIENYLFNNATKMGLAPATWVIAMRPDLWLELTAVWACAYYTNRCGAVVAANSTVSIDGREMVALRDGMRSRMTIEINGRTYPVVTDDGIFEHNNINNGNVPAGSYASSIYFVPLTIVGGFPVTYREHLNYNAGVGDLRLLNGMQNFWTDAGRYMWALEQVKWCYKFAGMTEQRVVLRTPQLAGRLDAVLYSPLQHLRDPFTTSPYFMDGGVSVGPNAVVTPYAVWTTR